jgi:hypothetical protein
VRRIIIPVFCLIIILLRGSSLDAQDAHNGFDTLKLVCNDYFRSEYILDDSTINSISIHTSAVKQMNDVHFSFGGDILRGALTLATGIGIGGSENVDWYLASVIRTNNPKLDWMLDVYCPGYIEKERTRVKNDDGSYSVETNYTDRFSWQSGAIGFIIESGDTIGWHYIYKNPRTDTALRMHAILVFQERVGHSSFNNREFALLGELAGNKNVIVYNTDDNRIYLFTGELLTGIFQCQKPPPQIAFGKKKRKVSPTYLLLNANHTQWERMDVLRLAMVGLRMKNAMENF